MRTEPGEEDDDTPEHETKTAPLWSCSRHPDVVTRLWGECPICQGEKNRQITTQIAHELGNFKASIAANDHEGERHAAKQLKHLGVGRDHLEMLAKLVQAGGGGGARRARKADL